MTRSSDKVRGEASQARPDSGVAMFLHTALCTKQGVPTEKWDFLGWWNQGNIYTIRGRLGLRYIAAHCVDFLTQELISTNQSKPKAS